MQDITVKKDTLLGILRENRDKHLEVFGAAVKGYATTAIRTLQDELDTVTRGKKPKAVIIHLDPPTNHVSSYDRVIRMVELHEGDTIVLSETDVQRYIQDDWSWKQRWSGTARSYAGEAYTASYGDTDDD